MLLRAAREWIAVLCCVAGMLVADPAIAQPPPYDLLEVRALQPLDFGDIVAGAPNAVIWTDAGRAGLWVVRGEGGAEVVISLALPAALVGPAGALLPIQFGPGDAAWNRHQVHRPVVFDPNAPFLHVLGPNGRANVHLGGTVVPGFTQPAGEYTATVTLTVAYTGS